MIKSFLNGIVDSKRPGANGRTAPDRTWGPEIRRLSRRRQIVTFPVKLTA